jgi:hypothetical protein
MKAFLRSFGCAAFLIVGHYTPASAQGQNPPGIGPTHYQCYKVEGPTRAVTLRTLKDQFGGAEGVAVGAPMFLCAPTAKNGAAPRDARTHYLCYQDKGVRTPNKGALIVNQFGQMRVRVLTPAMLCVPSLKRLI